MNLSLNLVPTVTRGSQNVLVLMNSFSLAKLIFALFNCHGCFAEQFLQNNTPKKATAWILFLFTVSLKKNYFLFYFVLFFLI